VTLRGRERVGEDRLLARLEPTAISGRRTETSSIRVRRFGVSPQSAQCRHDRGAQAAGGGSSSRSTEITRKCRRTSSTFTAVPMASCG